MANPLLRIFSQIGLSLATVVGKAFKQAYAKISADAAASQRRGVGSGAAGGGAGAGGGGGAGGASSMGWLTRGRAMPVDEAYKVLNIDPKAANPSDIAQAYEKLFRINDVASGGSLYLQSKVYRAKQTLDRIHRGNATGGGQQQTQTTTTTAHSNRTPAASQPQPRAPL